MSRRRSANGESGRRPRPVPPSVRLDEPLAHEAEQAVGHERLVGAGLVQRGAPADRVRRWGAAPDWFSCPNRAYPWPTRHAGCAYPPNCRNARLPSPTQLARHALPLGVRALSEAGSIGELRAGTRRGAGVGAARGRRAARYRERRRATPRMSNASIRCAPRSNPRRGAVRQLQPSVGGDGWPSAPAAPASLTPPVVSV